MRVTTDLFIALFYIILVRSVSAKQRLPHNKMNRNYILRVGRGNIPNQNVIQFDREAYPQTLPTLPPEPFIRSPFTTLYQGLRYKNDTRVFRKRFDYAPMLRGHQVACQGLFDCIISHISIESTDALPVLLRGGAGYRHFTAIIKARPGHELKGQVRAYCRSNYAPENDGTKPQRRFLFREPLEDEYWMD